jgi:hypothetical protein
LLLASGRIKWVAFTHGRLLLNAFSICAYAVCIRSLGIVHVFWINDQNNPVNHEETKNNEENK